MPAAQGGHGQRPIFRSDKRGDKAPLPGLEPPPKRVGSGRRANGPWPSRSSRPLRRAFHGTFRSAAPNVLFVAEDYVDTPHQFARVERLLEQHRTGAIHCCSYFTVVHRSGHDDRVYLNSISSKLAEELEARHLRHLQIDHYATIFL